MAQEQQIDILNTADAVTVVEEGILTPMLELFVEIKPLRPAVQMCAAAGAALIVVAAPLIALGAGILFALAQALEDGARPPVEMRIDDVHELFFSALGGSPPGRGLG